jgi:hypothetical protein
VFEPRADFVFLLYYDGILMSLKRSIMGELTLKTRIMPVYNPERNTDLQQLSRRGWVGGSVGEEHKPTIRAPNSFTPGVNLTNHLGA